MDLTFNAATKTLELVIFGRIGQGFFEEGVDAADIVKKLAATPDAKAVNVRINSGGGSAFDGIAIHSALKRYKGDVVVHVEGLAASAASVIAMAGDTINIATGGMIMIHSASTATGGNAKELRKQAETLAKLDEQMANIYIDRTGQSLKDVLALMEAETWFTAEEAVEAGLADEIVGVADAAACVGISDYNYKNVPKEILNLDMMRTRRGYEPPNITNVAPIPALGENDMKIFAQAAGLSESASEAEIATRITTLRTTAEKNENLAKEFKDQVDRYHAALGAEGEEALGKIEAGKVALALVEDQTAELEKIKAKAEADAHAALVQKGKDEGKLTADLEKLFSDKSAAELEAFLKVAPKVVPVGTEHTSTEANKTSPVDLVFEGKTYAEMSPNERVELYNTDRELFQHMSDDYRANLESAAN